MLYIGTKYATDICSYLYIYFFVALCGKGALLQAYYNCSGNAAD